MFAKGAEVRAKTAEPGIQASRGDVRPLLKTPESGVRLSESGVRLPKPGPNKPFQRGEPLTNARRLPSGISFRHTASLSCRKVIRKSR